jgi:hypothetical protein
MADDTEPFVTLDEQYLHQLLNQAEVKLSGVSEAGLKAELFDTLTEFFDLSSSWLEDIALDGVAYGREYDVVPDSGQIIRLWAVTYNGLFATNAQAEAAENTTPPTNQDLGIWAPVAATMPYAGHIVLKFPMSQPQALKVWVVKNVVLPTSKHHIPLAPASVLQRWHRYILSGILGHKMGEENKSYTNDALSTYHLKRFQEGITRARIATLKENTQGGQAWVYPQQFATRSQRGYLNVSVGNDMRFG